MVATMKAAVLHAPGDLRIEEVPVPRLGPDDVLVKVAACGVCGSDVPRVLTTGTYHFPTIPGHEFAGRVVDAGTNVGGAVIGRRVAVIPLIPCRKCRLCELAQYAQCEHYGFLGSRDDGGFAQFVRAPAANLVPVPDSVSDDAASLLEPISVALHVVKNSGLSWGDNAAVFGLGAIGNFVAQWAKAFGANLVFAVDTVPEKVDFAKRVGLEDAMCAATADVESVVRERTGGVGVDVAFEASGAQAAFAQAASVLRTFGTLALVGRPQGSMTIAGTTFDRILRAQLTVRGTWSFEFSSFPHHAWLQGLDALEHQLIVTEPLVTHRLPLDRALDALKLMAENKECVHKILIDPWINLY